MNFIAAMQYVMAGSYVSRRAWALDMDHMFLYQNQANFKAILQVYKDGHAQTATLLSGDLLGEDYFIVTNPIIMGNQNLIDLPAGANSYGGTPI